MIVTISDDFDLPKIADSGQCFRCRETEHGYLFLTGRAALLIRSLGGERYFVSCTEEEWENIWIPYFDLGRCYRRLEVDLSGDEFLLRAAEYARGVRVLRQDRWEMLVTFLLSQRKSIPAIRKCVEALCQRFGERVDTPAGAVHLFPTAESLFLAEEAALRECGLGYRTSYVRDAAAKVCCGELELEELAQLDNETLRAKLKTVRGVGDKVSLCVMLFAYARMSSVPVDVWIWRIREKKYGGADPFARYGENAGIVQQYAFYYILQHKSEVS